MQDFERSKGTSVATIFVLFVAIIMITGLTFFHTITGYITSELQDRIDITAYFKDNVEEEKILNAKDQIFKTAPKIKKIDYISKDKALLIFKETHKSDAELTTALDEVGINPFLPSLNISTTGDPVQYAEIASLLQKEEFSEIIEDVDFSQKKYIIEKVYSITSKLNIFGIVVGVLLVFVAMLVVYSTIKLTIQNSKEEISTMRIVGASDWFIRGPFVIQGVLYGLIAFLICFIITTAFSFFVDPHLATIMPGFGLFDYFVKNWWVFVLIQLGFGVGVGVISSLIVVKKHLDL